MKSWIKIGTCLLIALTALVAVAGAHEIIAPTSVQADGSGHFSYEITVVITSAAEFATAELDGSDNTDVESWIADGFCMVVIEPGTYSEIFEGNLIDVALAGSVSYSHSMCDGWTGAVTTVILAPVVGTENESWSAVKSLYR